MKEENRFQKYVEVVAGNIIYALSEDAKLPWVAKMTDSENIRAQKAIEKILLKEVHDFEPGPAGRV